MFLIFNVFEFHWTEFRGRFVTKSIKYFDSVVLNVLRRNNLRTKSHLLQIRRKLTTITSRVSLYKQRVFR